MQKYVVPSLKLNNFTCPNCSVLAEQKQNKNSVLNGSSHFYINTNYYTDVPYITITTCQSCKNYHIWFNDKMIYPIASKTPMPNEDMPENVKKIYEEARQVFPYSAKASAALLRLAIQHLCIELGEKGKNINDDIKSLVEKGLNPEIQQALDIIRVTGNNAVHPGTMDLEDNEENAGSLFELLNFIVSQMISNPKKIKEMFESLPVGAKNAIKTRDTNIK